MGNKFAKSKDKGKAKASHVSQADMAILELKMSRDKIEQHKKKVLGTMERNREIAAALLKEGKRDKALLALKRRKMQCAKLIESTDDQLLSIEILINTVEEKKQQQVYIDATRAATEALKQMQKEVSLEAVEKLMEDSAEACAYHDEINALLSQNLTAVDDDAMDAELESMLRAMGHPSTEAAAAKTSANPAAAKTPANAEMTAKTPANPENSETRPELPHVPLDLPAPPKEDPVLVSNWEAALIEEDDTPMPPPPEAAPA